MTVNLTITGTDITSIPAAYATTTDLAAYLGLTVDTLPTGSPRMLTRASELIDYACNGGIALWRSYYAAMSETDQTANTAKDARFTAAASGAACAQVEFWVEKGEDVDVAGPNEQYSAGKHFNIQQGAGSQRVAPTYLAPRAARILQMAGLLYRGASMA